MNAIVGSGTLITFPVLLAVGYPPVLANVSNTVGMVASAASGSYGYRSELTGQRRRLVRLGAVSLLGGLTGAVLLLLLPARVFKAIVPALIAVACVLVLIQPRISRRFAGRRSPLRTEAPFPLLAGVYGSGIYGGYFGAAQGILLTALLGLGLHENDLQRINGLKNVLAGLVNGVAALLFIAVAHVAWRPALLIAAGSAVGGQIGAKIGRRLPPAALRSVIVVVGLTTVAKLLTS
jgi:uncharacterized membrane protein YfcA